MLTSSTKKERYLKRKFTPYAGYAAIVTFATLTALAAFAKTGSAGILITMPLAYIIMGGLVYIGMKYRICWNDKGVCQEVSGGPIVCIEYKDIRSVELEIAGFREIWTLARPFRRIVIRSINSETKFIDVSVAHFSFEGINELIEYIGERRPDITLPSNWHS